MIALPSSVDLAKGRRANLTLRRPDAPPPVRVERVTLPITVEQVRRIASPGYPLWEGVEALQLRNRRITVAYGDMSQRLGRLLAHGGPQQDANFCTYAAWASKTIGATIELRPMPGRLRHLRDVPRFLHCGAFGLVGLFTTRSQGGLYRSLAAGNRFVFLENGAALAHFIETFQGVDHTAAPDDDEFARFWADLDAMIRDLGQLDLSWMVTAPPPPDDLRRGLRAYYDALFEPDPKRRAELILAGNVLIAAYEQRRVDGYVRASLALFANRAMRHLVQRSSGHMRAWYRRLPTAVWGWFETRLLVLVTPDEELRVGRALSPAPGTTEGAPFPSELDRIDEPLVQALLTRYDLTLSPRRRGRAWNWAWYEDRMTFITALFRSRQRHRPLFRAPFEPDVTAELLEGMPTRSATAILPAGPALQVTEHVTGHVTGRGITANGDGAQPTVGAAPVP